MTTSAEGRVGFVCASFALKLNAKNTQSYRIRHHVVKCRQINTPLAAVVVFWENALSVSSFCIFRFSISVDS